MSQDSSATLGGPAPPEVPATTSTVPATTPAEEAHRHNLSRWTLNHQPLVIFLLVLITLFGVISYGRLAQSEDLLAALVRPLLHGGCAELSKLHLGCAPYDGVHGRAPRSSGLAINGLAINRCQPAASFENLAGDGDHFAAEVVAEAFRGKTRVQQHKMVYDALKGNMGGVLHALALQTSAPD